MKKSLFCLVLFIIPFVVMAHGDEKSVVKDEFVKPAVIFTEDDVFSEIVVEMDNWIFRESNFELEVGKKYRFTFQTVNGHHGVVFPSLKMESENIPLGESVSFDFEFNETSEIEFYCNIPCGPGHNKMKGLIIVK